MKEFLVSLDIESQSLGLAELSVIFGRSPSKASHNKGDARAGGAEPFDVTIWRVSSRASAIASMDEQFADVMSQLSPDEVRSAARVDGSIAAWFGVAVMFDTATHAMASVSFSVNALSIIQQYGASLEVSCYPCSDGT